MANAPPAALLRLREADVVRLCGFTAAARGLELADHHAISGGRREGSRLEANVDDGAPYQVSVVWPGEGASEVMRWTCSAHAISPSSELGCAHIAALLTTWIRSPGDFPSNEVPPAGSPPTMPASPPPHPQMSQPALLIPARPPQPRGASLEDELAALPTVELLAIARRVLGSDLAEHEARAALAQTLADPARLSSMLARLDVGPRQLFTMLHLLGGAITATDLDALAQRTERAPSSVRAEVAVLARHGLIFAAPGLVPVGGTSRDRFGGSSWRALSGWRIPPEVRAAAPLCLPLDPLPQPEPRRPSPMDPATGRPHAMRVERASLRPLLLALALLSRAPAPLGLSGLDRVADQIPLSTPSSDPARLQPRLARPHSPSMLSPLAFGRLAALARPAGLDPAAAALARHLLRLAREFAPGQPLCDLARLPHADRLSALRAGFHLWRDAVGVDEMASDLESPEPPLRLRVDATHAAFRPTAVSAEVAQGNRFALRLLAASVPGAWYALDDFIALVWRLDPLFLRGRQQAYEKPVWWLESASGPDGVRRPLRASVRDDWMAGEAAYLRLLLARTLRAWGVVELATDVAGQPVAFRITPFGRLALAEGEGIAPGESLSAEAMLAGDWGPAVLPTRDGGLAVQPLAAGPELLDTLDQWARPTGVVGGRLIYALSADLACAAFDRGATLDELPQRLRAADPDGGERPAAMVARRLAQWHAAYGATRIQEGWALLEARDEPALIEALALVTGLAARCRRLDATHALVRAEDAARLRSLLARKGHVV